MLKVENPGDSDVKLVKLPLEKSQSIDPIPGAVPLVVADVVVDKKDDEIIKTAEQSELISFNDFFFIKNNIEYQIMKIYYTYMSSGKNAAVLGFFMLQPEIE